MSSTIPKVFLVTSSNLGPYHQARYSHLADGDVDLLVVKTPVDEQYRPWKVSQLGFHTIAPFEACRSFPDVLRSAMNLLRTERPDVVVCVGYNKRFVWVFSLLCRLFKVPCVLYSVGWEGERSRSWIKEIVKKLYCRLMFQAAMVTGTRAADYAERLGISPDSIRRIGNVVDNDYFGGNTVEGRGRFESLPANFFLTVARLSPEKNLSTLLSSFLVYQNAGGTWHLCIAGAGPQESQLRASVPPELLSKVHWLGWVAYEDLPALYKRASCFVLPSYIEPWGLVVNEAMAAHLPVLVSTKCGCQTELCIDGQNGYSFEPDDLHGLANLLARIEALPVDDRKGMGDASHLLVQNYSLDSWREAFCACVNSITTSSHREDFPSRNNIHHAAKSGRPSVIATARKVD